MGRPNFSFGSRVLARLGLSGLLAAAMTWACPCLSAPTFEAPDVLPAADVIPPYLLSSASHRVSSEVRLDDNLVRVELSSDLGTYDVTSVAMLEIRVHEIDTLAQAIAQYQRLNSELAGEIRGRLRSDADVEELSAPLGAASDLSSQLSANDTILAARGTRLIPSRPPAVGAPPEGPVYESHRRNVAYQLGLDPYSSNPQVQSFLATVAGARARGRFSAGAGLVLSAEAPRTRRVQGGRIDDEVRRLLRHLAPAELDAGLESEIERMGASPRVARAFLDHRWYSPRLKASIAAYADYLNAVHGRAAIFDAALGARSEAEALSFEQLARMLALYHEQVAPLARLIPGGTSLPAAIRSDGGLVLMLPVDYVFWTASTEATFDSLRTASGVKAGRPVDLVVRGRLSPRARRELAARGVIVRESFLYDTR